MREGRDIEEELNAVHCSPQFLDKVAETGRCSLDVLLEATDDERRRWLREGRSLRQQIHGEKPHISRLHSALRSMAMVLAGMTAAAIIFPDFRGSLAPGSEWVVAGESFGFPAPLLLFFALLLIPGLLGGVIGTRLSNSRPSRLSTLVGIVVGCVWNIHLSLLSAHIVMVSRYPGSTPIGHERFTYEHGGALPRLVDIERLSGWAPVRWFINGEYDLLIDGGLAFRIMVMFLPLLCGVLAALLMNAIVHSYTGRLRGS